TRLESIKLGLENPFGVVNRSGEPLLGHLQRSLGLPEEQQSATQQDVERRDAEQKVGQNRHRMHRINAGLHEKGFELGELFGGRVAALEAGGSFELTDEREQRTVGVMRRAVVAQPDMWFGLEPLLKRKRNA